MAQIVRFSPPSGMLIKVVANARSDEHIYILSGGHGDKSGRQRLFPGEYLLHPQGLAHGAFLAIETTVFQVYSGELDELLDYQILPIGGYGIVCKLISASKRVLQRQNVPALQTKA